MPSQILDVLDTHTGGETLNLIETHQREQRPECALPWTPSLPRRTVGVGVRFQVVHTIQRNVREHRKHD